MTTNRSANTYQYATGIFPKTFLAGNSLEKVMGILPVAY